MFGAATARLPAHPKSQPLAERSFRYLSLSPPSLTVRPSAETACSCQRETRESKCNVSMRGLDAAAH